MPEPITLAVVSTLALTEGIKFLFNQTGEVLKRWRERRDAAKKAEAEAEAEASAEEAKRLMAPEPINVQLPEVFEGQLISTTIDFGAVERLEEPMQDAFKELAGYAVGALEVNTSNEELLENVDALRQALEAVFHQRLTFKGEQRPTSGPVAESDIEIETIKGNITGIRAKRVNTSAKSRIKGKVLEAGGSVTGFDVDSIGDTSGGS